MKCVNCEQEMQDGLEQCPHCGCHYPERRKLSKTPDNIEKTEENTKQTEIAVRYCRYCGTPLSQGAVFCKECGKEIEDKNETNISL